MFYFSESERFTLRQMDWCVLFPVLYGEIVGNRESLILDFCPVPTCPNGQDIKGFFAGKFSNEKLETDSSKALSSQKSFATQSSISRKHNATFHM
jgi:hypothetical protein